MEVTGITVEEFKRVKKVELSLAPLNILVGSNGSGKSSVLQSIHLACCMIRQAGRVEQTRTSTVGVDRLDYLPSEQYWMLAHNKEWGNKKGSPSSSVRFEFDHEGVKQLAHCTLRSARNAGISITGHIPPGLNAELRGDGFYSAYIPGISGIPNKEEKRSEKVILKACSYGDSNIILRNALLLLQERDSTNISFIERWVGAVVGSRVQITVVHDAARDLTISCTVKIGNEVIRPIELIGTGYLQLIQLFAYILLFAPGVLLVDEPDIHLHPSVQEKLMSVLAAVARDRDMKVLISTHSPFVVRGAPIGTNVYWLDKGKVASTNRVSVELALGWGAFGKKVIIVSEDSKATLLKKLVGQWPNLDSQVTFYPHTGYTSLPKPKQAAELKSALGGSFEILIHRDRDSMTDQEVQQLVDSYQSEGITLWCPAESDVEAYFCHPNFIMDLVHCDSTTAIEYVDSVLTQHTQPIKDQFDKQRAAHNSEFYAQSGGSPPSENVWSEFQTRPLKGAKGKFVFNQLKNKIPGNSFSPVLIEAHEFTVEIAPELKVVLEGLV